MSICRGTDARPLWALLLALGLVLGACSDLAEDTDGGIKDDGSVPQDQGPVPEGIKIGLKPGDKIVADFTAGSEEYLVIPYSPSTVAASDISFEIKLTAGGSGSDGGLGSSTFKVRTRRHLPLILRNPALYARWQQRLAVERWQRRLAEQAASLEQVDLNAPMRKIANCAKSSECSAGEVCSGGTCASTLKINVAAFATGGGTIDVDVKKKGARVAILVDKSDSVSQTDIDALADKFDNLIYKRDVALFGNPKLKSSGDQLSSDRNNDGLIWIVVTSKVADKNAVGFFVPIDFVPKSQDAKSNEADILYMDASLDLNKAYATACHEFQHLLNYAVKVYKPSVNGGSGGLEALWLDEGQAHFAEDACGYGGENVTVLDQEVFTSFETTTMFSTQDSVAMRGMALLFVRYLFEQAGGVTYKSDGSITDTGGAALLQKIRGSSKTGVDAVVEANGEYKQSFDRWIAAVGLDGRGVTTDSRFKYDELTSDPITNNKIGIKIRGKRVDDTGATVDLLGPLEEDLTGDTQDSIPNATGKLFRLKGKTGKVTVSMTSQDTELRFAVLKLK